MGLDEEKGPQDFGVSPLFCLNTTTLEHLNNYIDNYIEEHSN